VDTQKRLTTRERYVVSVSVSMSDLGHYRPIGDVYARSACSSIATKFAALRQADAMAGFE